MIDFETSSAAEILTWAVETHKRQFALVTSFQAEGMVLLDMLTKIAPREAVRVLTIDTGRMPPETYQLMETVRKRYGVRIETITPDSAELSSMVTRFGPNLFLNEPAMRNLCCEIRKVRPLEKKLAGMQAYAVGLRRGQSESRKAVPKADESAGRLKLSPLADWTRADVAKYLSDNAVPSHGLYAQGYRSIGCAPCTRAVQPGEDERAGRWWWEQDAVKECGIHFTAAGQAKRKVDIYLSEVLAS